MKLKFLSYPMTGNLHVNLYTFIIISLSVFLRTKKKMFRKIIIKKIKTHVLCLIIFSPKIVTFVI